MSALYTCFCSLLLSLFTQGEVLHFTFLLFLLFPGQALFILFSVSMETSKVLAYLLSSILLCLVINSFAKEELWKICYTSRQFIRVSISSKSYQTILVIFPSTAMVIILARGLQGKS